MVRTSTSQMPALNVIMGDIGMVDARAGVDGGKRVWLGGSVEAGKGMSGQSRNSRLDEAWISWLMMLLLRGTIEAIRNVSSAPGARGTTGARLQLL